MSDRIRVWRGGELVELDPEEAQIPALPSDSDLDAQADAEADRLFEGQEPFSIFARLLADLTRRGTDLSEEDARADVRRRYRDHLRALLGGE